PVHHENTESSQPALLVAWLPRPEAGIASATAAPTSAAASTTRRENLPGRSRLGTSNIVPPRIEHSCRVESTLSPQRCQAGFVRNSRPHTREQPAESHA